MLALYDVPAPAKLNLFLHIVGRRADGYHLLQSVFMLIDWCDTLHFERRNAGQISREDLNQTQHLPEHDLVLRAARALQNATGCPWGAHIALDKCIPQQAGLGGGSSDAASTLLALNRLWGLGLGVAELQRIGLALGADVPFFLGGRHAWVEGIGESLQPIELPPARYLVLKPPSGSSTPEIFRHPALKRDTPRARIEDFAANSIQAKPSAFGCNDLQPVALELCPDIAWGLEWMAKQGLDARMSGSGSALFAPVAQEQSLSGLPAHWSARICSNLREHPLIGWC
ncbi:MAG: 4-(cytidine 5'-diphospho)-2-C-methyl-D-erythritol kinase [Serpentinimonas sp.]|nr:4-(cytidine 5'-diphospho)-2-C-methyl-D-erythritol kinase [Serpentinimonas sp.]